MSISSTYIKQFDATSNLPSSITFKNIEQQSVRIGVYEVVGEGGKVIYETDLTVVGGEVTLYFFRQLITDYLQTFSFGKIKVSIAANYSEIYSQSFIAMYCDCKIYDFDRFVKKNFLTLSNYNIVSKNFSDITTVPSVLLTPDEINIDSVTIEIVYKTDDNLLGTYQMAESIEELSNIDNYRLGCIYLERATIIGEIAANDNIVGNIELVCISIIIGERRFRYYCVGDKYLEFQFSNCFGCWESVCFYGTTKVKTENNSQLAVIDDNLMLYDSYQEQTFEVETSTIDKETAKRIEQLCNSADTGQYIITDSECVRTDDDTEQIRYKFSYRYKDQITRQDFGQDNISSVFSNHYDYKYY